MNVADRLQLLRDRFPENGLFRDKEWVLSPEAFGLSRGVVATIEALGSALVAFQRASNELYFQGVGGGEYGWVTELLDRGKPEDVIALGRDVRWRGALPAVIRPDLVLTDEGVAITELDSIPGGIGLTDWLNAAYAAMGVEVLGGAEGMVEGFRAAFPEAEPLISRESGDYEPEMRWLMERLGDGRRVWSPGERDWESSGPRAVYRFFELFDLANVEGSGELLERARAGGVELSPPPKAFLEEKLWLVLFGEPSLQGYWEEALEAESLELLRGCIPQGWVVQPTVLPAFGELRGLGAWSWEEVKALGGRERELVVKISGFSERGWGSRSVRIGHDLSQGEWAAAVEAALTEAWTAPHVMQRFHRARVVEHPAWDEVGGEVRRMKSRVRLCPYYFVPSVGSMEPQLGGVLATVCPADKKILHGMKDAMMLPCVSE